MSGWQISVFQWLVRVVKGKLARNLVETLDNTLGPGDLKMASICYFIVWQNYFIYLLTGGIYNLQQ